MVQRLWYGEMNARLVELEKESIKFSITNIDDNYEKAGIRSARKNRFGNLKH